MRPPAGMSVIGRVVLLILVALAQASLASVAMGDWLEVSLPPSVHHLSALTAGNRYLYAAMIDSAGEGLGIYRAPLDAPANWQALGQSGRTIREIIVVGQADDLVFIPGTGTTDLFWSTDGGDTWAPRDQGIVDTHWIMGMDWNGQEPVALYAVANGPVGAFAYRSTDLGATWTLTVVHPSQEAVSYRFLAASQEPCTAYTAEEDGYFDLYMRATEDCSSSWNHFGPYLNIGPWDLAASKELPDEVYVARYGYVAWFEATNYRGTFETPLREPGGVVRVETATWLPHKIIVGGVAGDLHPSLLIGSLSSDTWEILQQGLPDVSISDYHMVPDQFQLAAARQRPIVFYSLPGLGLWRCEYQSAAVQDHAPALVTRIWPNPVQAWEPVFISLSGDRPYRIRVVDVSGREVLTAMSGTGVAIANGGLRPGCYFVRVGTSSGSPTTKLIVLK